MEEKKEHKKKDAKKKISKNTHSGVTSARYTTGFNVSMRETLSPVVYISGGGKKIRKTTNSKKTYMY